MSTPPAAAAVSPVAGPYSRYVSPVAGPYSRYAWHFHGRAMILLSVWGGVSIHSEYILLRLLGGTPFHVAILMAVGTAGLFTGLISGPMMQGRRKRPFFLIAGAGGRTGLLIMACANDPTVYILGFALFSVTDAFLIPALTAFYQASYPPAVRTHFFGRATMRSVLTLIAVSLSAGVILQHYPWMFRHLLVLAAATGAVGWWQMARVRMRIRRQPSAPGPAFALPESVADAAGHATSGSPLPAVGTTWRARSRNPFVAIVQLFARDRRFFMFEMLFMFYGVAFMIMNAVIPQYLIDSYGISFAQIATARGLLFHAALAFGVPLVVGRLGHRSPMVVCVWAFSGLALVQVVMIAAPMVDRALAAEGSLLAPLMVETGGILVLYVGFLMFGLSMSGVHVVWNLASIYFAGDDEPTAYQGGHTLLVGVRGATAPFLGVWIAAAFSPATAFASAAVLFVLGAILMG
ncbi:MAG: MFS transporter, partial [Planctomycetota bacterium]